MKRRFPYCCVILFFLILGTPLLHCQNTYALSGAVVTPQGVIEDGVIVIVDGTIQSVGANVSVPAGTSVIKTDGVIIPGLIDLHDHLIWNVFPRWKLPSPVENRYDWQAMPEYAAHLSGPEAVMVKDGLGCEMERYAEVKAMVGGATSVVGSFSPTDNDPHRNDCDKGLARNLDFASGLYSQNVNQEPLRYEVFPFELPWTQAQAVRDGLASRQLRAFLIHVAEGKDPSASREFRMLKARGFLRPGVTVIHGVALRAPELREMSANGVGLVWSPRSNFELYGKTADVSAAKDAQLTIALAPDCSPTGRSGMLEELRYAFQWNSQRSSKIFDKAELLSMVTTNPARLAAISDKVGTLAPGMTADLIVLPRRGSSALSSVLDSQPGSIKLVVIGGRPILGELQLMRKLVPSRKLEPPVIYGMQKELDIADDTQGESWQAITSRLSNELTRLNGALAPACRVRIN